MFVFGFLFLLFTLKPSTQVLFLDNWFALYMHFSGVVLDFLEGVVFLKSVIRSLLLPTGKPSWKNAEPLGPVVQKVDNSIHWLAQLVLLLFIHWIAIYPVDSAIHRLKN